MLQGRTCVSALFNFFATAAMAAAFIPPQNKFPHLFNNSLIVCFSYGILFLLKIYKFYQIFKNIKISYDLHV
jgi:hypothetical protein